MGVQLQNLPKGKIKNFNAWEAIELVRNSDLNFIRAMYGDPMEVFSSCLRSVLIARDGYTFYRGDFSSIEVRVLFWLARHKKGLDAYKNQEDLYCMQAADLYGREILKGRDDFERNIGKKLILGAGFGLGGAKFYDSCINDGIEISEAFAKKAIQAYRTTHSPVPAMWSNLEQAALRAVKTPGKVFTINRISYHVSDNVLWATLPSGRRLAYYAPTAEYIETRWKTKKETLHHWSPHPKTKKWGKDKTWGGVLTENVVQAVARDLLVEAMLDLEKVGYEIRLTVHDEILAEKKNGDLAEFIEIMTRVPDWADGIPIAVDAASGPRYKKW